MDVQTVLTAISSVGFPIVACCAMFYLCYKMMTILSNNNQALENNTEAIKELKEKIGK